MTWRSITDEEFKICEKMVLWLETRKKWRPDEAWLPTDADISKSALFERLMNGLDPLPYPPPRGLSCPWYAVVEDIGPHSAGDIIGEKTDGWGPYFHRRLKNHNYNRLTNEEADVNDEVSIWQSSYLIEEKMSNTEFIVKDATYETPYRFKLWYDSSYEYSSIATNPPKGAWMLQNVEFDNSVGK